MSPENLKAVILKSATLQVFTSIIILINLYCSIYSIIYIKKIQQLPNISQTNIPSQPQLPNISQTNIPYVIIYINTPTNNSQYIIKY